MVLINVTDEDRADALDGLFPRTTSHGSQRQQASFHKTSIKDGGEVGL